MSEHRRNFLAEGSFFFTAIWLSRICGC